MELNKAIEVVRNIDTTDIHCKNCVLEEKDKCITDLFGYSCQRIAIDTVLKELNNRNEIIENIKEYVNAPEFLDWHLGYKTIDELEERKKEINKLLKE